MTFMTFLSFSTVPGIVYTSVPGTYKQVVYGNQSALTGPEVRVIPHQSLLPAS